MPLYEYRCASCGRVSEHLLSHDAIPGACPHCGASALRRKLSRFASFGSGGDSDDLTSDLGGGSDDSFDSDDVSGDDWDDE